MISIADHKELEDYEVARGDDNTGYKNSGFVAVVRNGEAAITSFGHCSCFGTAEGIDDCWDWTGTPDEMVALATQEGCLVIDDRTLSPDDYDYPQLKECYANILAWDRAGRPVHTEKED